MSPKVRATGRFSTAQDERLIEMVTNRPILWNLQHTEFKNAIKKDAIWQEVGDAVKRTGVQCKVRWKSIRDHYRRQRKPSGVRKRASYWDKLNFLDNADEERYAQRFAQSGVRCKYESESEQDSSSDPLELTPPEPAETVMPPLAPISGLKRKISETQHNAVADVVQTETKEERSSYGRRSDKTIESGEEDEIELFFKTMASTVKKFDSQTRAEVKMKIFNVVSESEMQIIRARKTSGKI